MPRRLIQNTSPLALGNGEQAQFQGTASAALRTTGGDGDVYTVTLSLDTSAYASGDLLADTQLIGAVCDQQAGDVILDSITVIDEDAQGVKFYVLLTSASTSMGTENSAPNISDANARNIIGFVPVLTTDYITVSGAKIGTVRNIGLHCKSAAGSQNLYLAVLNDTGTPTFTATGVRLLLGFRQA
jgi:hypothetical protein